MAYPLSIALTVEGSTDTRFLEAFLELVFQEMVLRHVEEDVECTVYPLGCYDKSVDFSAGVVQACKKGHEEWGVRVLAVHTDADRMTYDERRDTNFAEVFETVRGLSDAEYCKVITPVIPVRMTEAWMLADRDLLRRSLGTSLTNAQLGIDGNPESFADPKSKIRNAIRIAAESATHRKPINTVDISELYQYIGKAISIEKLEQMESFRRFEGEIINTFRELKLRVKSE